VKCRLTQIDADGCGKGMAQGVGRGLSVAVGFPIAVPQ
jgi:hypothetical protein